MDKATTVFSKLAMSGENLLDLAKHINPEVTGKSANELRAITNRATPQQLLDFGKAQAQRGKLDKFSKTLHRVLIEEGLRHG
jgi:hypothetical protein